MTMFVLHILLLTGLRFVQPSTTEECNPNELGCENGDCIKNEEWCDGEFDCVDGSDELYCNEDLCRNRSFLCENKRCIPESAVCNGYDNCGDGSDEKCNDTSFTRKLSGRIRRDLESPQIRAKQAVVKAAQFLLRKRDSDYGWGSFTPRALIALAFAEKVFEISEEEKTLMKKNLDVQILLYLKRNERRLNLIDLAFYINALYAVCDNPRNFNGIDLVDLLRSETDREIKGDFNLPFVFMTLCLANEKNYVNTTKLITMYDDVRNDRIGFKALTIMAMCACHARVRRGDTKKMKEQMTMVEYNHTDFYTYALANQAAHCMGKTVQHNLWLYQLEDGSFGDLLETYYAIPVLLSTSLNNLKCDAPAYDEKSLGVSLSKLKGPKKNVTYTLWMSTNGDIDSHTMYLTMERHRTLHDVMMLAESRDPLFRFTYDKTHDGNLVVYSLAGRPNDAEAGMMWNLYRGTGRGQLDTKSSVQKETRGIKDIVPEDGSHYIFWRERKFY